MKVAFLSFNCKSTPHFETELELMMNHLDKGDEVFAIRCLGEVRNCASNPYHDKKHCQSCINRFNNGMNIIGFNRENIIKLPPRDKHYKVKNTFSNIYELKEFQFDGINLGRGVLSNFIFHLGDHKFDPIAKKAIINEHIQSAIYVYQSIYKILDQLKPDVLYLYNGRFGDANAALKACEKLSIKYIAHERGASMNRYALFENCLPHSISNVARLQNEAWANGPEDKEKIGAEWFTRRKNGVVAEWYSFTKDQEKNSLPLGFDRNKQNIAIFNSSINEYDTILGWENPLYKDELQALEKLFEHFKDNDEIKFYLRIHPNLKGAYNAQIKELKRIAGLRYKNLEVIGPNEKIDTYSLLDNCEKVITFGSTMGIEACFWGKPSILAGRSLYEHLDCCYIPFSHEEFMSMVKNSLSPKSPDGAIKYGYWVMQRGITFKYFEASSFFEGKFMGKEVSDKPESDFVYKIAQKIANLVSGAKAKV